MIGVPGGDPNPTEALVAVIHGRLTWSSMHWGTEGVSPDAWPNIAKAIITAGWRPPASSSASTGGGEQVEELQAEVAHQARIGEAKAEALRGFRPKCPLHGIPDCSALLNGCTVPRHLRDQLDKAARNYQQPGGGS